MKKKDELLREFDEVIQYFIGHIDNEPRTIFCDNVDKLINLKANIANEEDTNQGQALNLDSVMQRVLKWWERLPDNMNGDVSKYQYAYRHFERHWMSLTYREIEKIYGIEHVA